MQTESLPSRQRFAKLREMTSRSDGLLRRLSSHSEADIALRRDVTESLDELRSERSLAWRDCADYIRERLGALKARPFTINEFLTHCSRGPLWLVPDLTALRFDETLALEDKLGFDLEVGRALSFALSDPELARNLLCGMRRPSSASEDKLKEFTAKGFLELSTLFLQQRGRAAFITLTNSSTLNAEDVALLNDLEVAVDVVCNTPDVGVGVIRGGVMTHPKYRDQRIFCSGLNLRAFRAGRISLRNFFARRELGLLQKLRLGVTSLDADRPNVKPWVMVVDGFAIGGGLQLLMAADCVLAESNAYISLPAASEGIIPGVAALRLTRFVGSRAARALLYSDSTLSASSVEGRSFFDGIAPSGELGAMIEHRISLLDREAVVPNKVLLAECEEREVDLAAFLGRFCVAQAHRMLAGDVHDRVANFNTKSSR